jgi:hypothetical protein
VHFERCETPPSIIATFGITPSPHRRINAPSLLLAFAHIHGEAGTSSLRTRSAVVGPDDRSGSVSGRGAFLNDAKHPHPLSLHSASPRLRIRKLPGYEFTHAVDVNGKGLCLKASQPIPATPWTNKTGLCEYSGTERPVDPQEHVYSIPLRQLMYGCEYYRDGKLYCKSPDQDMGSLLRYMQAPNPGEEPTCCLMIVRDKAKSTTVSLFINRPIQPQEDLTIEYGGPYWQIFWNHLSLDQQRQIKIRNPDITFPPHWPQAIPSGHRNQKISTGEQLLSRCTQHL